MFLFTISVVTIQPPPGPRPSVPGVRARGRLDVISEFAYPLPAIVIAELLGVPPG